MSGITLEFLTQQLELAAGLQGGNAQFECQ